MKNNKTGRYCILAAGVIVSVCIYLNSTEGNNRLKKIYYPENPAGIVTASDSITTTDPVTVTTADPSTGCETAHTNDSTNDSQTDKNENKNKNDTKININTAGKEELMSLKGIGTTRAEAIIAYREEYGDFQNIEDIMKVSGIKNATFSGICEHICVK